MPTDLLIVGDSHTRALQAGCAALGVEARTLTFSGNVWFDYGVEFCPENGLRAGKRKWIGRSAAKLASDFGAPSPFQAGLPVLLSCMNLGRLAGRFHWRGHEYHADAPDLEDGDIPTSRAVLRAYVENALVRPLDLIRSINAQGCPLVVVGPPNFTGRRLHREATTAFADLVRGIGPAFFNPWDHRPAQASTLPPEHADPDGRHGNEAYGAWAMQAMIDSGLLDLPQKKTAKRA